MSGFIYDLYSGMLQTLENFRDIIMKSQYVLRSQG